MTPFLFTCPICQTEICERSRSDTARCVDGCFDLTGSNHGGYRTILTIYSPFMRIYMIGSFIQFETDLISVTCGRNREEWVSSILRQMMVASVMSC